MSSPSSSVMLLVLMLTALLKAASAETFHRAGQISFGNELANILNGGKLLTLSLDNSTGSGYQSTNTYLFGRFDMNIKLVPGNSAGTVATFYLSSQGANHDEIDFEFLGNASGQPYTIHTNIYSQGVGNREQQFRVWFDLTAAFHKYTVIWNPQLIILMVDDTPIRVFNNNEAIGVPFPNSQAMTVYATIWDGETWATEGGRIPTDWTQAPFTASYESFVINACEYSSGSSSCGSSETTNSVTEASLTQSLDSEEQEKLLWVQENCMIYNYCTDYERFPQGLPPECNQPYYLQ
ncbi:xyloglucan endotransglucosylase protein 7-like [Rhododendron vialii]|uniref:xyloglucan endotransglucosylase protein 7-like n=1 Tax=Rhododendron vialii TaxID=182163 RepID=UPI00265DA9BC|nr:xyloglucan endotransglucosylase protein 7-like [Rhododendron vialii]